MKKRIFYDVDTQNDFMNKDGALYVPDAELLKPNLEKLTQYAKNEKIPIFGSVDRHFGTPEYKHREIELKKWGGRFPDHCMAETQGEIKIQETNPSRQVCSHHDQIFSRFLNSFHEPDNIYVINPLTYVPFKNYKTADWGSLETELNYLDNFTKSLFFEKQEFDIFTNPYFEEALKKAEINEAVVYGVATDCCVKAAVLGMQARGIQCYVVEDAVAGVEPETTKSALEEMLKAGAKFVKTQEVLNGL